jgi:hypothetical protein
MSRRRCSTPISSASSASMADGAWRNVLRVSVPSCRDRDYERICIIYMNIRWWFYMHARTSLISSTAKYASVGMPTVCGLTSTMTITGRAMYRLNNSLISKSDARSFGPVWYHPIMRSRAAKDHSDDKNRIIMGNSQTVRTVGTRYAPLTFLNISNIPST